MSVARRVLIVVGTRPEVVKMAPVHRALVALGIEAPILSSGQHADLVKQALDDLGLGAYYDAGVMLPRQSLATLTSRLVLELGHAPMTMAGVPDLVLVQGDTTTALCAALSAFYQKIPVGHVEAGLRSDDSYDPFPEEMNRRLISQLTTLHFAPSLSAVNALRCEGAHPDHIFVTGNTAVDELYRALTCTPREQCWNAPPGNQMILVTCHRREHLTSKLDVLCTALATIAAQDPSTHLVWPLHPNPVVGEYVRRRLTAQLANVHIIPPQPYTTFAHLLKRAALIISDSGGVTEEAVVLGKRLIMIRDTTERPEAIQVGNTLLPLSQMAVLPLVVAQRLNERHPLPSNVFGDGHAGERIAWHIDEWLKDRA